MDAPSCPECCAIYLELREALSMFANTPGAGIDRAQLGEWIRSLDGEEYARIRETSSLWKAWRRLQEHRRLTGHVFPCIAIAAERDLQSQLRIMLSVPSQNSIPGSPWRTTNFSCPRSWSTSRFRMVIIPHMES